MIKPIGSQVLIKVEIVKKKTSIELLPGTVITEEAPKDAVVEAVGTNCHMGLKKGHSVMFKEGVKPIVVEQTDEYELLIVPEVSVFFIKNWSEEDEKTLQRKK